MLEQYMDDYEMLMSFQWVTVENSSKEELLAEDLNNSPKNYTKKLVSQEWEEAVPEDEE